MLQRFFSQLILLSSDFTHIILLFCFTQTGFHCCGIVLMESILSIFSFAEPEF